MALFKFYKNEVRSDLDYISSMMIEIRDYRLQYYKTTNSEKEVFKFAMQSDVYTNCNDLLPLFTTSLKHYKSLVFRTKMVLDNKPVTEFVIDRANYNVNNYYELVQKVNAYFGGLVDADQLKVFNKGNDVLCFTIVYNNKRR